MKAAKKAVEQSQKDKALGDQPLILPEVAQDKATSKLQKKEKKT